MCDQSQLRQTSSRGERKERKQSAPNQDDLEQRGSPKSVNCNFSSQGDNLKQENLGNRRGGRNRRREGKWQSHREKSVRHDGLDPPVMAMDKPLRYSSVSPDDMPPRMHQNMPPRMQQNMPPRMQQNMPPRMQQNMPPRMQQHMPPRMQRNVPPRMQENMPPRMQENMPPHMQQTMPPCMQQNRPPFNKPPQNMPSHTLPTRPLAVAHPLMNNPPNFHQRTAPRPRKERKPKCVSSDHPKQKSVPESLSKMNSSEKRIPIINKQTPSHSRDNADVEGHKNDPQFNSEQDHSGSAEVQGTKREVLKAKENSPPSAPIVESYPASEKASSDNVGKEEPIESLQGNDSDSASAEQFQNEMSHSLEMVDCKKRLSAPLQKVMTLTTQLEPKLTTDTVPMNFGIELLNSVIHNNIELIADQEVVIRANSVILSMNSPVIHRITTSLELKEIDMKEFSEKSVRIFVEAAYTGRLPDIPSELFRDLHKMSWAFQVEWLCRSCFAMFSEFSSQIDELLPPYLEQVFLFEEAAYILSKLKLVHFQDLAIAKIQSYEFGKKMFISKYLKGLSSLSASHLDMIVLLAGSDTDLIVEPLTELLLKQLEQKETVISDECKYLLNKCDLSPCRSYSSNLFEQLFDVLQELAGNSSEDMKWVFQLHRNSANKSEEILKEENRASPGNVIPTERKKRWFWQK